MRELSDELRTAFESDDAEQLDQLIKRRRKADFDTMMELLTDTSV